MLKCRAIHRLVMLLALLLMSGGGAKAQSDDVVPEDACVLELDLPEGATVTIDGRDYGTKRKMTFGSLERGRLYPSRLRVAFPDGTTEERELLVRGGWRIPLHIAPPGSSAPELVLQTGHMGTVNSVAFCPDGGQVLTGSADNTAILWDARTGQKLRTLAGHTRYVTSVAVSLDGGQALTGSWDKTATLWDARTGRKLRTLSGHTRGVLSVAFSPDGGQALTGSDDQTAILWDARTGRKLRTLSGHTGQVTSVAFSPDGGQALTGAGSGDSTAILWDARTGQKLRTLSVSVTSVAFSPDGGQVLTGSRDNTAILWDARTGQKLRTLSRHISSVTSVAFSPDGAQALTGSHDKTAILWDARTGRVLRTLSGHTSWVNSVAFSPDGGQVLTGSGDQTAILWDARTGEMLRTLSGHTNVVNSVAFSPDGGQVLTDSSIWDARTGQKLRTLSGHTNVVNSVTFSPDGGQVLTGAGDILFSTDNTAILWDARTGEMLRTLSGHTNRVTSVAFSPDGGQVLTGSEDNTAILWDARTGQKLRTLSGHTGPVAFSPDGGQALTGSDNSAILWDARTGQKLHTLFGHTARVMSLAFSPDSRHVLTAALDGSARVWDLATGEEVAALISLDAGKDWLVVNPDGFFDGSDGGRQQVTFRVGGGLNVVPVDRFFQDFYRPGLLAEALSGHAPTPQVELGESLPPTVKIVSPAADELAATDQVVVEVEATDEGGGIQGPWLRHNGARVAAAGQAVQEGMTLRQAFTVRLIEGDNRIRVEAASADGSWESEPARVTLSYNQSLPKPELYILAVGVNRYAEAAMNLAFAARDAEAVAALFQERGERLYNVVHVRQLLDDQATKKNIRDTLAEIAAQAQPQDALLVFLSGHGFAVGQRYYFIPHELARQAERFEDDIRRDGLPIDELGDSFRAVPALKRMLILDTCNSGAAIGASSGRGRNPFAFQGAVERLSRAQGIFTLAAAAATEDTAEVRELEHGVLTYSLLAGLKAVDHGPLTENWVRPDNPEQVVGVLEWFNFATGQVPRLTKQYLGEAQDVKMSGEGTSFPVLPLGE